MAKIDTDLKILQFDIETSMALGYFYGLFDQTISINRIVEHPRMIAFSSKWYGKGKVEFFSEYHQSRQEMLEEMHKRLDEADVVVGWNSQNFDVKWVNAEFILEGMPPPSPFKQLDLLKEVKRVSRFLSNKLDYVSGRLLETQKINYNMADMWVKVNNPNVPDEEKKREWNRMMRYAKRDTQLLEPLLDELLPWLKMPHPVRIEGDERLCRNCGSGNLERRGYAHTLSASYPQYACKDCRKWQRGTALQGKGLTRDV